MPDFLCFTLEGPMAAWGNIATGEQRGSWSRPSKSAVIGVIAAALGITRDQEDELAALHEGLGFGVLVERPGLANSEFQTETRPTQSGLRQFRKAKGRGPATWGEAVSFARRTGGDYTSTSRRTYYVGALYRMVLWARTGARVGLGAIAGALDEPVYAPFLGRRAFPLSRPMNPRIIAEASAEAALIIYAADDRALSAAVRSRAHAPPLASHLEFWCDLDAVDDLAVFSERQVRRDSYRSTAPREFTLREEGRLTLRRKEPQ